MNYDWNRYSEDYLQFYEISVPRLLETHLISGNWHVFMDVGCGEGNLLLSLDKKQLLRGMDVIAVDISESRVQKAQGINRDFRCYVDDACELKNVRDESVDVIASMQVIEHVPNDEEMVAQLKRVLSKGGIAYISTVFKKPWARYLYKNADGESVIDPSHTREYKDSSLLDVFEKHSFEIIESRKRRILKPVLGFRVLSRINPDRHLLGKHPLLRVIRRLKLPIPGYYRWEIVVRKKFEA